MSNDDKTPAHAADQAERVAKIEAEAKILKDRLTADETGQIDKSDPESTVGGQLVP